MSTILQLCVVSDFYGQQIATTDPIGLTRISFNRSHWQAPDPLSMILIPDGAELTIRRNGRIIEVIRP